MEEIINQVSGKGQGRRGRPSGYKCSKETKQKTSMSKKGQKHNEETKTKIASSLVQYFQDHPDFHVENKSTCERCGQDFTWDTTSCKRTLCDECVEVIRNNNNGEYQKVYRMIKKRNAYRFWRLQVLIRDECSCRFCNKPANVVHHIISVLELIDKPELLYNQNIGITLCNKCHGKLHWHMKYDK